MIPRASSPSALLRALVGLAGFAAAQTFTNCNPLTTTCPPNPALGGSISADFTSGPHSMFTASLSDSRITYTSRGAQFQVASRGDSPTLSSNFYIMFGRVSVTMLAAPGTGIVSSVVLQSDDLDEIDWEWLGGDTAQVQSNYFGKGNTQTYDRAAFIGVSSPQTTEHTYTIEWTSKSITWIVDGVVARVLNRESSSGGGQYYPQTPMQIKLGAWAGGDPSNAEGTIAWAGGLTDYSQGPFNMYVRSLSVQDFSTGTSYSYSDNSGSDTSIRSEGGTIGFNAAGSGASNNNNNGGGSNYVAPPLTDIPINNGLPGSAATGTPRTVTTTIRTPYVVPTSAEEYWAGTGFRVSSASMFSDDSVISRDPNVPYIVNGDAAAAAPSSAPVYIVTTGAGAAAAGATTAAAAGGGVHSSSADRSRGGRRLDDLAVLSSLMFLPPYVLAIGWGLLAAIVL